MITMESAYAAQQPASARARSCRHVPPCPSATAPDRLAARTLTAHPEQGWSLLCNGIITFDDTGALTPGGNVIAPPRAAA
ncbi:MAG: hypothetical protein JWM19_3636 [Actinomycetia bacterium]|nr:hypothetical protein [Actinomycetes bacterium]